jgi:hypothetical protein
MLHVLWKDKNRRNLVAETQHDRFAAQDYELLRHLGIAVAREGIPWPLVDKNGVYDFSPIDPMIEAMNQHQVLPIWDLCHYGYPTTWILLQMHLPNALPHIAKPLRLTWCQSCTGPIFLPRSTEITYFSFIGGEWGWVAPYKNSKEDRYRLRLALCKAAIAGVKALRSVAPDARMVHIDPLVQVVAPKDRPDLQEAARHETYVDTFLAWDILYGKEHPELGGAPELLDIVGANNYSFGQMEYREQGPHEALAPDDERIKPLCEMMHWVWDRYKRPMIIGETSGLNEGREDWLRDVMDESLAAVEAGIDLHGVCLFPAVDMPDWHTGKWLNNGLCDVVPEGGVLKRVACEPYIAELRRWQKELNRVTELDEDPFSDPVELQDVVDTAKRLKKQPDQNWS